MALDLILRGGRVAGGAAEAVDIGIVDGRVAALEDDLGAETAAEIDLAGQLVVPGFVESHIHLDKSRILDRTEPAPERGTDHMTRVAAVKPGFTVEDVHARAGATLLECVSHGTTAMRTHVEVDANVGLRGFEAIQRLAAEHAWAIDLEICVFVQEGWTNAPEADANVVEALRRGAPVVGGAPGYDPDRPGQIRRVFELAREFDVDVDIHLDVGWTTHDMDIELVCRLTDEIDWGGRVAIGHGSKYSCLPPAELAALGRRLADAGVAVTVLPATDLFVTGRHQDHAVMRGVADANALMTAGAECCLSSNNVLNPFTPFGDGSLLRMANLYANTVQRGSDGELAQCFEMLTTRPARLLGRAEHAIAVGHPADLVVLDAATPMDAIRRVTPVAMAFKHGHRTVTRAPATLHRPLPSPA